jgi:hypothetical protein
MIRRDTEKENNLLFWDDMSFGAKDCGVSLHESLGNGQSASTTYILQCVDLQVG